MKISGALRYNKSRIKNIRGRNLKSFSVVVSLVVVLTFVFAGPALAYLDGGTGSMVLQLLLGGVAGLIVFLKVFWHSILSKLGIRKEKADNN